MNEIDGWFERSSRREFKATSLYVSFLTGRALAYFRYRLRMALTLDVARFVIHVAEFLIILASFGEAAATMVVVLRSGSMILNGAWWGVLEIMRERLRGLTRSVDEKKIEYEIGRWLALSIILAGGVILSGSMFCYLFFGGAGREILFYGFLIICELALFFPMQVLHSGIFATRRIYRPLWSLVAPVVVQLLTVSVGVIVFPGLAAVVALIAAMAVSIWTSMMYTLRAYRFAGIRPRLEMQLFAPRRVFSNIPIVQGMQTALAGVSLRLDAAIVLAITGIYGTDSRTFDLAAGYADWRNVDAVQFFYLTLPLLRGAYETTGIFYFDLVRLRRRPILRQIRIWFFRKLLWIMSATAVFFWLLAVGLGLIILSDIPFSFLLAIFPIFIIRSLIGTYQIRMFADGRFFPLILSSGLLIALLGLVWIDVNPASDLLQITAVMIVLLVLHINFQHFKERGAVYPSVLALGDWIDRLSEEKLPVYVGRFRIPRWVSARQKVAAMDLLQSTFDGSGYLSFRAEETIIFYCRQNREELGEQASAMQTYLALQSMSGGAINRGEVLEISDGAALDALSDFDWIADVSDLPARLEFLYKEFERTFPEGISFDLKTQNGYKEMREIQYSLLREFIPAATRGIHGNSAVMATSEGWMSSICYRGELRALFIFPRSVSSVAFSTWVRTVNAWQLRSTQMGCTDSGKNR
ncbi:hypothetical protein LQL77_31350 [Rhodococcus cerastii]|nr:hypothetical protein [Rhodococcus cerastii]